MPITPFYLLNTSEAVSILITIAVTAIIHQPKKSRGSRGEQPVEKATAILPGLEQGCPQMLWGLQEAAPSLFSPCYTF